MAKHKTRSKKGKGKRISDPSGDDKMVKGKLVDPKHDDKIVKRVGRRAKKKVAKRSRKRTSRR